MISFVMEWCKKEDMGKYVFIFPKKFFAWGFSWVITLLQRLLIFSFEVDTWQAFTTSSPHAGYYVWNLNIEKGGLGVQGNLRLLKRMNFRKRSFLIQNFILQIFLYIEDSKTLPQHTKFKRLSTPKNLQYLSPFFKTLLKILTPVCLPERKDFKRSRWDIGSKGGSGVDD